MEEPIRNRVSESGLLQLELSSFIEIDCVEIDFTSMLVGGAVVVEREFRKSVDELDEEKYECKGVGLIVTEDAIIPDWAWMVICAKLHKTEFVVKGGMKGALNEAIRRGIENIDLEDFRDKRVIVRGCDTASGPAGLLLFQTKVQPVVKSIMFGEACSTVPIFKKK